MALNNNEDEDADQDLIDEIAALAHDRMDDKVTMVRVKAIDAIYLLQENDRCGPNTPRSEQCDVTQHLMQLVAEDAVPVVRAQALRRIEAARHSLHCNLQCMRDCSGQVRRVAVETIQRVPLNELTVQQRQMIDLWLQRVDPVRLLEMLDINMDGKLSEQVAIVLYEMRYKKPDLRARVPEMESPSELVTPRQMTEEEWDAREQERFASKPG
eukprot:gene52331-64097_t